jgi:hypothetical protein
LTIKAAQRNYTSPTHPKITNDYDERGYDFCGEPYGFIAPNWRQKQRRSDKK